MDRFSYVLHLLKDSVSHTFLYAPSGLIVVAAFFVAGAVSAYLLLREKPRVAAPVPEPEISPVVTQCSPIARVEVRLETPATIPTGKPAMSTVAKTEAYLACGQTIDYAARLINPSYAYWSPRQQKQYVAYLQSGVSALTLAATNGCIVTVN